GLAQVFKTVHASHGGKLSLCRVLAGRFADGDTITGSNGHQERIAGVFTVAGQDYRKHPSAVTAGDTVAFGRLETIGAGETLANGKAPPAPIAVLPALQPVYGLALTI